MGSATTSWQTYATLKAAIWPVSAKETIRGERQEHRITHQVRIRYLSGLNSAMRVNFGGRILEIVSIVNPEERNRHLDLMCEEVSA